MTSPGTFGLRQLVDEYRTCELATIAKSGVPVAWPAVALVSAHDDTITITTSIGAPRKAYNIRRDARVALLFSDQTGTGRSDLPQVLVRGTATCPDEIHSSPAGLEEYWTRLYQRQPSSRANGSTAVTRRLMDWYYMRLVITVTPTSVEQLPPLAEGTALSAPPTDRRDKSPYAALVRKLPSYRSGVLGWVRGDELPVLQRVQLRADPGGRQLLVSGGDGAAPTSGPASILLHSHNEQLWDLQMAGALGELLQQGDGWAFRPDRLMDGPAAAKGPIALVRALRSLRRTASGYLERRHLPRPQIAWDEFKRLT